MITALSQSQFVSRIFTDSNGRRFRLNFFVAVIDGEIRGHLISVQPLPITPSSLLDKLELPSSPRLRRTQPKGKAITKKLTGKVTDGSFYLPIVCDEKTPDTLYISPFTAIVSPYFSLEFLINSQPTRAPSCN